MFDYIFIFLSSEQVCFIKKLLQILSGTQQAVELISPAAALVVNLHVGALDDTLDVSRQIFAFQVHR